jgi:predicted DNA-binding transcriptional regulator YafY
LRADALDRLNAKIRSATRASSLRRLGPDVEALARAEASLARAGPRPVEDPDMLKTIREALMAMKALEFRYQGGSRPGATRQVCPYGLLFERTNYLIGSDLGQSQTRTWRLDRIEQIRVLEIPAAPPAGFDLQAFADRSFGVYQDAVEAVVLRVRAGGVADARRWRFHPSQIFEDQPDGSLLVRFYSSGMLELAWHLFTWGDAVEILEPPRLQAVMRQQLQTAWSAHRGRRGELGKRQSPPLDQNG